MQELKHRAGGRSLMAAEREDLAFHREIVRRLTKRHAEPEKSGKAIFPVKHVSIVEQYRDREIGVAPAGFARPPHEPALERLEDAP